MPDRALIDFQKGEGFQVENPHGIGIVLKEQAVLFLAPAQFLLRAPPVGHIPPIRDQAADVRVIQPVLANELQMFPGPVLVLITKLNFYRVVRMFDGLLQGFPHQRQILG